MSALRWARPGRSFFGRGRAGASWAAIASPAAPLAATLAVAAASAFAVAALAAPALSTAPSITAAPTATSAAASPAVAVLVVVESATASELCGDGLEVATGAEHLEALGLGTSAAALGRHHAGDEDAVDLEVGLGADHVADGDTVVEQ
jgi:hypothetical protein